ncbi:16602_t:CDS:2 [Funneliformis geosporum]|nr:16602_t:CDS:2 [Funneliformis geosporum]
MPIQKCFQCNQIFSSYKKLRLHQKKHLNDESESDIDIISSENESFENKSIEINHLELINKNNSIIDNMVIDSNINLEETSNTIDFNDNNNEFISQEILNISDINENYENDNEYNDEYGGFPNGLYRDFMNLIICNNLSNNIGDEILKLFKTYNSQNNKLLPSSTAKAWNQIISPLLDQYNSGIELLINKKRELFVIKLSLSIADWPEAAKLCLTYGSRLKYLHNALNNYFQISDNIDYKNIDLSHIKISIYSSAKLKNGEFIRITHKSLTDEIFSDIAIQMSDDETDQYLTDNELCYAKVLLLLKVWISNEISPLQLLMIHWYDFKIQKDNQIYRFFCPYLKMVDLYNIIPIEAVENLVHIIPSFANENSFYVNKFIN